MALAEERDPTWRDYVENARLAEDYDEYFADSPLFAFDRGYVARVLAYPRRPEEGYAVLDLGCGTGRHLLQAAENHCLAVGVDLNPHMLAKAKRKAERLGFAYSERPENSAGTRLRILRADIEDLPLREDERFDAALIMFSTLGLVHGQARRLAFLRNLKKRLKPGGKLVLHVHNENHARKYIPLLSKARLDEAALTLAGKLEPGDHMQRRYRGVLDLRLHYFTAKELRGLLPAAGYSMADFLPLNDNRDGRHPGPNPDRDANGFLLTAIHAGETPPG